jgi:glycosyltransferase involved in cell wall biosynthesis
MKISVIVPVYNDSANLARCYGALARSTRLPDEVLVVDDGSTESLPEAPAGLPVRAVRLGQVPSGSFVARNRAAAMATGDLLLFVDSDVTVHDDALAAMERYLAAHTGLAAAFGSYDDRPAARAWVSRYRNLLHHYIHQHGRREATTFWTGFGAMRREVFEAVGAFSTDARTVRDIDMGARLRARGFSVHLCPEIQVTHLKRWTFRSMVLTDIRGRAAPWSRLVLRTGSMRDDLNLAIGSRWSAVLAWLTLAALCAASTWPPALAAAVLGGAAVAALNRDLYAFMARHGGPAFALGSALLHALYLLYSSATFGAVLIVELAHAFGQRCAAMKASGGAT